MGHKPANGSNWGASHISTQVMGGDRQPGWHFTEPRVRRSAGELNGDGELNLAGPSGGTARPRAFEPLTARSQRDHGSQSGECGASTIRYPVSIVCRGAD
jgi:hypothetical protein